MLRIAISTEPLLLFSFAPPGRWSRFPGGRLSRLPLRRRLRLGGRTTRTFELFAAFLRQPLPNQPVRLRQQFSQLVGGNGIQRLQRYPLCPSHVRRGNDIREFAQLGEVLRR